MHGIDGWKGRTVQPVVGKGGRFQTHCLKLIINPLISLRLKSFHVYLPWTSGEDSWESDREDDEFRPSEQDLEQMVMGNG
jgi:hypothetical protein